MSAYTPGPWYVAPTTPENIAVITIDGRLICDPCPMSRADARLIASAPELARLLSRLAGFAAHHASDSAMAAGGRDLVAEARALLARVDGDAA
jgi:hypothetical protein